MLLKKAVKGWCLTMAAATKFNLFVFTEQYPSQNLSFILIAMRKLQRKRCYKSCLMKSYLLCSMILASENVLIINVFTMANF